MNLNNLKPLISKLLNNETIDLSNINRNEIEELIDQLSELKRELISLEAIDMINNLVNSFFVPAEKQIYFRSDRFSDFKQFVEDMNMLFKAIENQNHSTESELSSVSDAVSGLT